MAVVTGAAGGIGQAITWRLSRDDWHVVLGDIDEEKLVALGRELGDAGRDHAVLLTDVTDELAVEALADLATTCGQLGTWVNAAGGIHRSPFLELTVDQWDRMMDINARSCFLGTRAAGRRMGNQGGSIINVASISSVAALPNTAHYGAAKGAVASLTRHAALELGPHSIRVNAVAPGTIRSPMTADRLAMPGQEERTLGHIPMGRIGEPEDVAAVVAFLARNEAGYVNGATVHVDGGWYAT